MADAPAIAAVLISPSCRAAVAAGETGMAVRLIRQAVGWSQQDLANRSGYSHHLPPGTRGEPRGAGYRHPD